MNTQCPFCGSKDVELHAKVDVSCYLDDGADIKVSTYWKEPDTLKRAIKKSSCSPLRALCRSCNHKFHFSFQNGFERDMD